MKKLIIFLLMMLPLGVFAQESKIAIVNTQEVIRLCRNLQRCRNKWLIWKPNIKTKCR